MHRRLAFIAAATALLHSSSAVAQNPAADTKNLAGYGLSKLDVRPGDWPQFGGTSLRNNAPQGKNIPTDWTIPDEDDRRDHGKNIKWKVKLGSQCYGTPVVANGKVYVGLKTITPNSRIKSIVGDHEVGCLFCLDEATGRLLWQHANPTLWSPGKHDGYQGQIGSPIVDGERLWYITNRSELVCLDTAGFDDKENDGPYRDEESAAEGEADVIWKLDLIKEYGIRPHFRAASCVTCAGDVLFVITGNGVDGGEIQIPAPTAPAFMAFDRNTAKLLWSDNTPGSNIVQGQWSSPTYAVLGGKPQVLMAGGDGWLYSFDPRGDGRGNSKLLWKFDGNVKGAKFTVGGRGTLNHIVATPVVYDGKVYFSMGLDSYEGQGPGRVWCIDPTKRTDGADVSTQLVVDAAGKIAPPRRGALAPGERAIPNPESAEVWHYDGVDLDGDGKNAGDEEVMHRSVCTATVRDDLLYVVNYAGFMHCLDAKTGRSYWIEDLLSATTGWNMAPLVVDGKVYFASDEGVVHVFAHDKQKRRLGQVDMSLSIYTALVVANNVLYIATRGDLYAIAAGAEPPEPRKK